MYNSCILDLHDRNVMASKSSTNITAYLAIETLCKSILTHKPSEGLILHSDQGSQYTSKTLTAFCETNKVQQYMSKSGCTYDNAPMESFYGKLKSENLSHYNIKNTEYLDELINDYILDIIIIKGHIVP